MKIKFRKITKEDVDIIFSWANDPLTRRQSFSSEPIKYEKHVKWFNKKLSDNQCLFLMGIDDEDEPIGSVRLDFMEKEPDESKMNAIDDANTSNRNKDNLYRFLISYQISPEKRGMGYGNEIIKSITEKKLLADFLGKNIFNSADSDFLDLSDSALVVLVGEVKKENIASIKCFRANKFDEEEKVDEYVFTKEI